MLLETADFTPGDATWQTGRSMRRLWFWPIRSIIWRHDVIHKSGSIWCIASRQWRTQPWPQVTCHVMQSYSCVFMFVQVY